MNSSKTPGPGTYELEPVQAPRKRVLTKREHYKFGTIAEPHVYVKRSSSYSMVPKDEVPGPGNYEVAKASEKIRRGVPIASLGSLPRFIDQQKRVEPG